MAFEFISKTIMRLRPTTLLLAPFVLCADAEADYQTECELLKKNRAMANRGNNWMKAASVYEFSYVDIDGKVVSMEKYRGKVLLVVNIATQDKLANTEIPQLIALHEKYSKSHGLAILAFPCDQFGKLEPWENADIKEHLETRYKVQFDVARKTDVNGDTAHPLYKFLRSKEPGCWWFITSRISWNFTKFLIDREGHVVARYTPYQPPYDILKDICQNYWFDPPKCTPQ